MAEPRYALARGTGDSCWTWSLVTALPDLRGRDLRAAWMGLAGV